MALVFFCQIMAQYGYSQLENVAVDIIDDAVSLNMKTSGPEEQRSFNFETEKKEDIASLIASYSPVHSNWKRVGEAKTKLVSQLSCLLIIIISHTLIVCA